ncbi:MAG: L-rhamnose/proton symporter RhaT [Prevotellaceae bacterium]|jgi:L-rhamnose-H+ transport protein|nr:L-rhamnose/proton symporter RhaT [Prevotellaceae bacterium]
MNILIGLLIIALGCFATSSFYVPINKIKSWSWESFWLIQGVFAWLIVPFFGAYLFVPSGTLLDILSVDSAAVSKAIIYGALWGVGGLTFGLGMRYLGVALGQSLAYGTCAAFGTLLPPIIKGDNLLDASGIILIAGVAVSIAAIAIIGYAGGLKSQSMTEEQKRKAVKEFALKKGLIIALVAGFMSACFSLGLEAGEPIKQAALAKGCNSLFAQNPITMLVTLGGFFTNLAYCLFQNIKNKTISDYVKVSPSVLLNNVLLCALAGLLWYCQFFGQGMGKAYFGEGSVMLAFSWSILMSFNILFANLWGIWLKEWKGVSRKTIVVLLAGLLVLVFSTMLPELLNRATAP